MNGEITSQQGEIVSSPEDTADKRHPTGRASQCLIIFLRCRFGLLVGHRGDRNAFAPIVFTVYSVIDDANLVVHLIDAGDAVWPGYLPGNSRRQQPRFSAFRGLDDSPGSSAGAIS